MMSLWILIVPFFGYADTSYSHPCPAEYDVSPETVLFILTIGSCRIKGDEGDAISAYSLPSPASAVPFWSSVTVSQYPSCLDIALCSQFTSAIRYRPVSRLSTFVLPYAFVALNGPFTGTLVSAAFCLRNVSPVPLTVFPAMFISNTDVFSLDNAVTT